MVWSLPKPTFIEIRAVVFELKGRTLEKKINPNPLTKQEKKIL